MRSNSLDEQTILLSLFGNRALYLIGTIARYVQTRTEPYTYMKYSLALPKFGRRYVATLSPPDSYPQGRDRHKNAPGTYGLRGIHSLALQRIRCIIRTSAKTRDTCYDITIGQHAM